MKIFDKVITAIFKSRPNRFVVDCRVSGRNVRAYLPNPGKLRELLLPGVELYLVKEDSAVRKMKYTVVAVKGQSGPILMHTHLNNTVAAMLIEKNRIPGLEGWKIVRAEYPVGRSRFDFLLGKGKEELILEVKSCTLFSGRISMFPDAVTARGKRHLLELASISDKNRKTAVLFLVHSRSVDYFIPEFHTDLEFAKTLLSVRNKIMVKAVSVGWSKNLSLSSRTKDLYIPWELISREAEDRGSYITILRLKKRSTISVGKLGECTFKKGYYLYIGSAMGGLTQRTARHQRRRKKLFWHIDYLREHADFVTTLPFRSSDDLECLIADCLANISDWNLPNFGSSDCKCSSHLFGMKDDPLQSSSFIDLILQFRMGRLENKLS